jgi:isopentenyl-diphosphate delta-isomerase
MSMENVILVDEKDNQVGLMPKLEAHQKGLLHRAFSVFIFNSDYKLLLQKRASSKYHSGGLWTNTCCSHPRDGEDIIDAANRRLNEEMGIKTSLRKVFDFIYTAELDNNLIENEFDHVFYGVYDIDPIINKDEAEDFKWVDMETLKNDIENNKDQYTVWFKIAFDYFYNYLKK